MAVEKELIHGINAMVNGKEEGFNTLYSYTYNYVYGRAKLIMKNEQDAMDLTQETFIQAYKGIQTLDDVNNVYAWLGSIVYRQGMRIYRKRKNELLVDEEAESIFEDIVSEDKDYSPEDIAEVDATAKIIMDMINELPEIQRVAIMAFYYDNMKIDQIADVFECSSNTIKSRLNYAKKTLKEKVEAHEKANRYKLHSLTPAVFVFAGKFLFAEKEFVLAAEATQAVYGGACTSLGFVANPVVAATTAAAATETVTTGATTVAGVETAVTGTATAVAAKVGLSVGAKFLIGMAATVVVGASGVGIAASTGHLDIEQVFQQVVMQEEDDEDEDVREEDGNGPKENDGIAVELDNTEETEQAEEIEQTETQEDTEMTYDSYGEILGVIVEDSCVVESAAYSEEAVRLAHLLASTMMLDRGMKFDMTMLTEEQRQILNYTLLNEGFAYGDIPTTTDVVENAPGSVLFDTEVLNAYLAAFYEGGNVGEPSGNLSKYEDYTVYWGSDAGERHTFTDYTISKYEDYLMISAPCYYMDVDGIYYNKRLYYLQVLFKVTENELYPVQMVHVSTPF